MLRYLAALMVCMLVLAIQAGPAMAHNGDFTPSGTEIRLANAEFRASAAAQEDCPTDASCCKAICAPCFAPLCTYQGGLTIIGSWTSKSFAPRQTCLRSFILGRDPPVPRNQIL